MSTLATNKKGEPLYPLHIDKNTTLNVTADKNNEEYAQEMRMKFRKCGSRASISDMTN